LTDKNAPKRELFYQARAIGDRPYGGTADCHAVGACIARLRCRCFILYARHIDEQPGLPSAILFSFLRKRKQPPQIFLLLTEKRR